MRRTILPLDLREWLNTYPLIIVGYWDDDVRGVNLSKLLEFWFYSDLEDYPYAGDFFRIEGVPIPLKPGVSRVRNPRVSSIVDSYTIQPVVSRFKNCPHIKAWHYGEPMVGSELTAWLQQGEATIFNI